MATKSRRCNYRKVMNNKGLATEVIGLGGTLAGFMDERISGLLLPYLAQHEMPSVLAQK